MGIGKENTDMKNVTYAHTDHIHNLKAPREVVPIIIELVKPKSILDVGCGTGTWLKAFEEHGITDYTGIDGEYLDVHLLRIPREKFYPQNLQEAFSLHRTFDLVISLEVAEHIEEKFADQFVQTLVTHGDVILFSSAIPGQGGQNHVNEQWPEYWQEKFERHGYYYHDLLRPQIWYNEEVQWWYRQNTFLLMKEKPLSRTFPLSAVHPAMLSLSERNKKEMIDSIEQGKQGLRLSFRIFVNAIQFKIRRLFGYEQ